MDQVEFHVFEVTVAESRLDQYLAALVTGMTRSRLSKLIVEGQVLVNGGMSKPSNKVRVGDLVSLSVPPPRPSEVVPQDIPVSVVYQDDSVVVIDKPAGLAVHPGPGHPDMTLVNALLAMCPDIQGIGGEIRPGIVHRLDKDTSGLMMVAKTHQAHNDLSSQIKADKLLRDTWLWWKGRQNGLRARLMRRLDDTHAGELAWLWWLAAKRPAPITR
ncbi:MAG: hypothetical protein CM1200mP22_16550 [Dehalococcoidia bacterium]|nr:MAG: hypothetical protein CM1200mP22_16550 [Dehalococcoidia bacterium]